MIRTVQVTSWSSTGDVDFKSGRWVMIGKPSRLNFWLTGLPGGKLHVTKTFPFFRYERSSIKYEQHKTTWVSVDSLKVPTGIGPDGCVKALFNQRIIR